MNRDEYRNAKRKSTNTATLIGIFASVLFIVVLFVFMWFGFLRDWFGNDAETVIVPNFVGQRVERILDDDQYDGVFNFNIVDEISDDVEEGVIISQNPPADREMPMPLSGGIRINLVVSIGREPSKDMPDLVGLHFSAARNLLNGLNMGLEIIFEDPVYDDDHDRGIVIKSIPSFGEPLSRGDTVVITYSSGPNIRTATVPDLLGRNISVLQSAFEDLEMVAIIEEREDSAEAGTVLWIQRMGEEIVVPATLRVIISSGPAARTAVVPDMINHPLSSLETRFAQLELTPIITRREDASAEGTVLEIENMNQTVNVPANINVVVSSGPPPPPPDPPPTDPED
jgi:serine/threonine-protein kinase